MQLIQAFLEWTQHEVLRHGIEPEEQSWRWTRWSRRKETGQEGDMVAHLRSRIVRFPKRTGKGQVVTVKVKWHAEGKTRYVVIRTAHI
jgi:hypothetical protein